MAVEGKPKPKLVLWVATPQRLIAIDMSKLKINHYEFPKFEVLPLPLFNMLNLAEKDFPFGMSYFVRDFKLYMVGGEKPKPGASPLLHPRQPRKAGHDKLFGDRGLSPYVYVLDLTGLDSTTDLDLRKHHTSMLAAKPIPIVEEIEGKIYVLSGTPWQAECLLPVPTFEVYDPSIEQWKPLPEPPFHEQRLPRSQIYKVIYHSVVGTTIYVLALSDRDYSNYYYSYNVNEGNWKLVGKSVDKLPVPYPFTPLCVGKFVPAYNDIFIYIQFDRVYAATIPSNDKSSPTRYQHLDEVDGDLLNRDVPSIRGVVVDLGEHEMCIMQPGITNSEYDKLGPCCSILYITTFKVEKLLHSSSSAQARGLKLLKTADASDVSQTSSHHDNGNCACHYTH